MQSASIILLRGLGSFIKMLFLCLTPGLAWAQVTGSFDGFSFIIFLVLFAIYMTKGNPYLAPIVDLLFFNVWAVIVLWYGFEIYIWMGTPGLDHPPGAKW